VNRNHWTGAGYDGGGNVSSVPNQTFTYDAENRLISTTQPNSPAIGYAYDGDGKRVQKTGILALPRGAPLGAGRSTFAKSATTANFQAL
jgi:YD repeat-containing protein